MVTLGLVPSSERVSEQMRAQRSRDTGCEIALRRELHALGLRFRVHRKIFPKLRREADITFGPSRVVVFIDGCFWHACPKHGTVPIANREWWENKLMKNRKRDSETNRLCRRAGWKVIRVWEHEEPHRAACRIAKIVHQRLTTG